MSSSPAKSPGLVDKIHSAVDSIECAISDKVENVLQQAPDEVESVPHAKNSAKAQLDADQLAAQSQKAHQPKSQLSSAAHVDAEQNRMMEEEVILVDRDDKVTGSASKRIS